MSVGSVLVYVSQLEIFLDADCTTKLTTDTIDYTIKAPDEEIIDERPLWIKSNDGTIWKYVSIESEEVDT